MQATDFNHAGSKEYAGANRERSRYVADPLQITQLQSKSFIVEHKDFEGGSGANFIVEWKSDKPVSNPIIEAIMIGIDPEYQVSFLANGVPLQHTK